MMKFSLRRLLFIIRYSTVHKRCVVWMNEAESGKSCLRGNPGPGFRFASSRLRFFTVNGLQDCMKILLFFMKIVEG